MVVQEKTSHLTICFRQMKGGERDMAGPMKLKVEETALGGYGIWLDEKKLHHVKSYKIESSPSGKTAELSLKILVKYP